MAANVVLVVTLALSLVACSRPTPAGSKSRLVEATEASMGTELRISVWTSDQARAEAAFDKIFQEFDRLESLMSNWREGSEIQTLNAAAGKHPRAAVKHAPASAKHGRGAKRAKRRRRSPALPGVSQRPRSVMSPLSPPRPPGCG